ncbi:NTF2-like N-terminal transpeptidase domain-containing protein [Dactylosporangium sp. CA-139066]|uniref:NTF2-like N-terminal transpeptidase domain-containing protein n=1 Tax=Dactylosporangium sp. CA-139066 TaxID=3239930 RepID=UPI003D94131C
MSKLRGTLLLLAALIVAAPAIAACDDDGPPSVDSRFAAFLDGWRKGDFTGVADLLTPQGRALDAAGAKAALAAAEGEVAVDRPTLTPHGRAAVDHADATLGVGVAWTLPGGRTWTYDTTLTARLLSGRWHVYLGPQTVHPGLQAGQTMTLRTTAARRGTIVAGDGTPIVADTPVVYVGVEPQRVPDVDALVKRLDLVFRSVKADVDVQSLAGRIKAAKPDAFVDVVTLRRTDFDEIAADLDGTEGVRTRAGTLSLTMTRTFARGLLGTSGPATKELIDASRGALRAGDIAGLTGLQRRYDPQLRGRPGLSVVPVDIPPAASPSPSAPVSAAGGKAGDPLYTAPPADGIRIATTIDVRVQQAADAALASTAKQSALVAIRVSDGAVLAVANGPGAAGYDLALLGEVPAAALPAAPAGLGIGAAWKLGEDVFTGRADGNGVVAAPIGYAAAAAALARGQWQQPVLLKDPAPGDPAPAGPAVSGMLSLTALSAGVRGDIAYCVYVTGSGADVTGPIAEGFLAAVHA